MQIKFNNQRIGEGSKPFIIAEMSGNHNQSIEKALEIVDAAARCGADAIKLQTYTADTITMEGVFTIDDPESLWKGKELHQLYKEAYTPWEWHKAIFDRAKEKNILAFSSPFDESAVDFLETLQVPLYKIASFENTHHPLLRKVAATGKPVIMSTGVATLEDIEESVEVLKSAGCKNLILLKCTSTYPASPENTNLRAMQLLNEKFNVQVGLSDHTMGIGVSIAAVALGAAVIEKHFTLSRAEGGVDAAFSMEPLEMQQLVEESSRVWLALGKKEFSLSEKEKESLKFKRSIYVSKSIKKGEFFTEDNIKVIRPSFGMHPRYFSDILGKIATSDLRAGQPLRADNIENLII